jgi:diadenosine tetraphosphate (Ap4A) HIT family hydrolase
MPLTPIPDPKRTVVQSTHWAVVLNENQNLIGSVFCLLKREETDVTALTEAELNELWAVVRKVKRVLDDLFAPDHYNYAFLMNLDAQVHFHIRPRYRGKREYAGGTFVDPEFGDHYGLGPAKILEDAVYQELIGDLRKKFSG